MQLKHWIAALSIPDPEDKDHADNNTWLVFLDWLDEQNILTENQIAELRKLKCAISLGEPYLWITRNAEDYAYFMERSGEFQNKIPPHVFEGYELLFEDSRERIVTIHMLLSAKKKTVDKEETTDA